MQFNPGIFFLILELYYHAGGSHASGTYCTLVGVSRLSVMFIYFNVAYLQLHTTDWQIKCIELMPAQFSIISADVHSRLPFALSCDKSHVNFKNGRIIKRSIM